MTRHPFQPNYRQLGRTLLRLACMALAGSLFNPCLRAAEPSVVARVGGADIDVDEIRPSLENLGPREQEALARNPSLLSQAVRTMLVQRLVYQEAIAKKWDKNSAVEAQIERARETVIVESYLQSVCAAPSDYPTEAELAQVYEENKAALHMPRQFRLAQIFIAVPADADAESTRKAQARLEAVKTILQKRSSDFGAVAAAQSDHAESAARQGEIGWLAETQIQPEIRACLTNLKKDAVSEPVRLNDGWHIMKVLDIKESYTPTLAQVREQLAGQLRARQMQANRQAYLAKVLQDNPVVINELALSRLLESPAKQP